MFNKTEITTIPGLRAALKRAHEVRVQVRFGVSEDWLKLPKGEAEYLIKNIAASTTPRDFEMHTDVFGTLEVGPDRTILFLG